MFGPLLRSDVVSRGRRKYFRQVEWKNRVSSALNFPFLKEVSHNCNCFVFVSTSKIEEVSQNCFVFDIVKFKNSGSLEELLRFWCCQGQKLRKSRRLASFSSLQISIVIGNYNYNYSHGCNCNYHYATLLPLLQLHMQIYITLHYTTLHYTTLITLHYTTPTTATTATATTTLHDATLH